MHIMRVECTIVCAVEHDPTAKEVADLVVRATGWIASTWRVDRWCVRNYDTINLLEVSVERLIPVQPHA